MEDLIRRSDAISRKGVSAWLDNMGYPRLANAVMDEKRFPSTDRPQGEWICHEGGWKDLDYYPTKYECDQCHHYVDVASDKKFCPNCGARMKGAEDDI